jgi:hypothetical protein
MAEIDKLLEDAAKIDEAVKEEYLDDVQDLNLDLNKLYNDWIVPIENIRSKTVINVSAGPKIGKEGVIDDSGESQEPQESRAHAFLRGLGIPVVASDGKFFNPGFNPKKTSAQQQEILSISGNVAQVVRVMQAKREIDTKARRNIFRNAGQDAALFSLALSLPEGQKKFNNMKEGADPLEKDSQELSIPNRHTIINKVYTKNADGNFDAFSEKETFSVGNSHMIRPLTTDPLICSTVRTRDRQLCVPFPENNNDTYKSQKLKLKRCGLELIIRLRLKQRSVPEDAAAALSFPEIKDVIGDNTMGISTQQLKQLKAALGNLDPYAPSVDDMINASNFIELRTLDEYVRTLKGVIIIYAQALDTIKRVSSEITWVPFCRDRGPEGGTQMIPGFAVPRKFLKSWELERRIIGLKARAQIAKNQQNLGSVTDDGQPSDEDKIDYSDFVFSQHNNVVSTFDNELAQAEQQKKQLETEASDAIRTIEIVMGEVSGLGLVDILAVHIALWSLDISVLLSLLDDAAAERLWNLKYLRTQEVQDRKDNGSDIETALKKFDDRVYSILSYSDMIFDIVTGNYKSGIGDVPRG